MSVTIQVPIPEELIPLLERRARSAGIDREQYISALLSRDLTSEPGIDLILAGFREQVRASGLSDAELSDLFTAARREAHVDKGR